jgi:hypothetical protein
MRLAQTKKIALQLRGGRGPPTHIIEGNSLPLDRLFLNF